MILVITLVAGCENVAPDNSERARPLTGSEMDRVTVGSAVAENSGEAVAIGTAPLTSASTSTLANTAGGRSPIIAPLLNAANSSVAVAASGGTFVQAAGASQLQVNGGSGGAGISAAAISSTASANDNNNNAEVDLQFTGASLGHVDLAYGSVSATACCNASDQAQADLDSTAGGPYTSETEAEPTSDAAGEAQKRIDAAVASSTLPLLDAGQAITLNAPPLRQSISQ